MPFNSSQNSSNSKHSQEESFQELRNSYSMSKEGFDHIPHPSLIYRENNKPDKYILPANIHSSVGYYNQDELKYIDNKKAKRTADIDSDDELEGAGIGKVWRKAKKTTKKVANKTSKVTKQVANKTSKVTKQVANKTEKGTRGVRKTIVKSTVNKNGLIHQGIEKLNDKLIPMAGEFIGSAAGTYLTGDPTIGAMIGKQAGNIGRNQLKKKTGYGAVGVGEYSEKVKLDKILSKYAPNYKDHVDSEITNSKVRYIKPVAKKNTSKMSDRNKVVSQIMKEKGLTLPQASKYVKENNLF
jgi:hypothetical protein